MSKIGKPSPAMVVATVALIAALGGTAWALSKGEVKKKHIAKNAVVDRHLAEIDGIKLKKLTPSATNADDAAAEAAARRVRLVKHGKLRLYAKCWRSVNNPANPGTHAGLYFQAPGGAIFDGDDGGSSNDVLPAGAPESERRIHRVTSFAGVGNPGTINTLDHEDTPFYVAQGRRWIGGSIMLATKVGSPDTGDGVFGSGNRCLVAGTVTKR